MGKLQTALYLGAASVVLGGCAPMGTYPPQTVSYGYIPTYSGHTQYSNYNQQPPQQHVYRTQYQPYNSPQFMRASFNRNSAFSMPHPSFNQNVEPADAPARRALMQQAHQSLGVRYTYGGETPTEGFDCSGLMQYVYKNATGTTLPRTAAEQSRASRTVQASDLRPGDLVFFRTSGSSVNHVGMYRGRGEFIHAATGGGRVVVANLNDKYWQQRFVKFGRFVG